ncbi:Crp/Fnr family transcriptional regulator [Oligoflexia bacterium]|nr:Crp/Fnr family transcriptional regulator [Oligoflexia bacterium]
MSTEDELRAIPLLSTLDENELKQLAAVMRKVKAPKGKHVIYAEDEGNSLMFVADGKVKVSLVGEEGKEIVLAHFEQGEFFGEISLLTGEKRSADVIALTNCVLFVLTEHDFQNHISQNFGFTQALLKELALRLRTASEKIGDLALFDVYRRVARTLKSLAVEQEVGGQMVYVIEKRPTHQELAAMVGTSREMVTRALKGLEEDECISIDGKRIELQMLPMSH